MKELIIASLLLLGTVNLQSQVNQPDQQSRNEDQENRPTATLKSSTRLFGEENDLTTVIMIIPSGSVVEVLGADSAYYHVAYEDNEGYILKRHATLNMNPERKVSRPADQDQQTNESRELRPVQDQDQRVSRFSYLENKYGTNIAAKIMQGKIWLGMSAEMVKDSWGSPQKISRVISGNIIKEEWIYNKTWLYIENNSLREWGPVKEQSRP
jgi:hypothetical protein